MILYVFAAIGAAAVLVVGAVLLVGALGWWLDWDDRRAVAAFKRKHGA